MVDYSSAIRLDRSNTRPLHKQVSDEIERLITGNDLHSGAKLPSTRDLALGLKVNRHTIVAAYRHLQRRGLLTSGIGQGTFVAPQERAAAGHLAMSAHGAERGRSHGSRFPWSDALRARARRAQARLAESPVPESSGSIDFSRAIPDPNLYPIPALRSALAKLAAGIGKPALDYAPASGYEPLREALFARLRAAHPGAPGRKLVIVNGSQQGLQLLFSLLLQPGDQAAVDHPTFPGALDLIGLCGATPMGYRSATEPFAAGALAKLLARGDARLVYAIPSFHNPTGMTLDAAARRELVACAASHQVPVVEDDWLGELRQPGDPSPLWTLDTTGHVATVSTFSKVVAPGLRIGWVLVPDEAFEALAQLKRRFDLCTNLLGQIVLFELLQGGALDPHLDLVRTAYRNRGHVLRAAIARHFPPEVRASPVTGGITTWVELDPAQNPFEVVDRARRRGVLVSPGHLFVPEGTEVSGFRLCYAAVTEAEIERGIEILGGVLNETLHESRSGGARHAQPLV